MNLEKWTEDRHRTGTLADVARRMYQANISLEDAKDRLQHCLILEALIDHEGNQVKTAVKLGCHRNSVYHVMVRLGIAVEQIRSFGKALKALREGK